MTRHGATGPDLLTDLRVVDLTTGPGRLSTRLLSDLGADVVKVQSSDVARMPVDVDVDAVVYDAGKRSIVLDLTAEADRTHLYDLLAGAGLLVEDGRPGALDRLGLTSDLLRSINRRLTVVSLSDFGQSGPYRDWRGSERVQLALSGVLSRSGLPDAPPVLPPGELATQSAALQAAWAALAAWYLAQDTGIGDRVDVSVFEAAATVLDPGFGVGGSATGGVPPTHGPRGRPDARHLYPIFPCADGQVRICLLAPRQWRGMRAWLGEPAQFADPALEQLQARFAVADELYGFIGRHLASRTRAEILTAAAEHGFPAAALLTPGEVLRADHYAQTGALADRQVEGFGTVRTPDGFVTVDGVRASPYRIGAAPGVDALQREDVGTVSGLLQPGRRPLQGLRVLDLGVIVVGAETSRLLADMGADVIKIESAAFPDGARQSLMPGPVSAGFAYGHRGKRSFGLDLRSVEGKDLFRRLVAVADVVLSNFKPRTMESLGFAHEELAAINPGIITAESSAFGVSGPWSHRMGYGPLVRASAGLTHLWASPGQPNSWCDASTVYPDHAAARVQAVTVLAALSRRRRTGTGAHITSSQADIILGQLAPLLARESMDPGSVQAVGNVGPGDAPRGLFPCAGDDEWVAVDVCGDEQWARLVAVLGANDLAHDPRYTDAAGRVARRDAVDARLTDWTRRRTPREAMAALQHAGVPAGAMNRVADLQTDPHLRARGFLAVQPQPTIEGQLWAEARHAHFAVVPDPALRPAPLRFEHTREIAEDVLDLTPAQIDRLLTAGVLLEREDARNPVH